MNFVRTTAIAALMLGSGCGIVTENLDGTITVDFTVDKTTTDYDNELAVNPNDYAAVRDNCSSIDKETGQIQQITVDLRTAEKHRAQYGYGEVYMRGPTAEDWPDIATLNPADAVAVFDRVPLVDGQRVNLIMTPATRRKIARLVFTENCDQEVQMKLVGHADQGPVNFSGHITLTADFVGRF